MIIDKNTTLAPGEDLNGALATLRARAEYQDSAQRDLRYLPGLEAAAAELAAAESRVVAAESAVESTAARLRAVNAKVEQAANALRAASMARADAEQSLAHVVEQEEADFAAGADQTHHDLAGAREALEAARRRVDVLKRMVDEANAPLDEVSSESADARKALGVARARAVRAALVHAAATYLPPLVEYLEPLVSSYKSANRAFGSPSSLDPAEMAAATGARLEFNRVLEQITRELAPILSKDAMRYLPFALPRLAEAPRNQAVVELVVRPGNRYGEAKAGERVLVSEDEAANQLRISPMSGEPMGALETPEAFEARVFAAEAARQRPRHARPSLVEMIEAGLARIREGAEAKAAEKAAAEQRQKADAALAAADARRLDEGLQALIDDAARRRAGGEL